MAYIGNTADQQAFTPAVDFFSGNGVTVAFTLSRPVASVAQVQATIENVPQNPGTAFTVSGNTITFDGAPASGTNNIYVYYTSPITQVVALPQSPQVFGNLQFSSTGARITGDMSNATLPNRMAFQTSTTNGATTIMALPNGTGVNSQLLLRSSSSAADDSFGQVVLVGGSEFRIASGASGTGTFLPMTMVTNNAERMRIDTSGNVGIGTSSPAQKLDVATTTGNIAISVRSTFSNASASVYYGASRGWFVGADVGGADGRFSWYDNTAGVERMRLTSSSDLQFNSGYGSVATAYGCRAWISYAGVGAFIRGSGNVSSVTRNATGDYTVNFTTAMVDANYAANVTCNYDDAGGMTDGAVGNAVAGSCRIICHDIAGGTKYNPYSIYLSVFR